MPSLPTSITSDQPAPERTGETIYSWTVHLTRRQPHRVAQLIVVLLGVFVLSLCLFQPIWLALLPTLALLLSLSEFFFPIHYTLTTETAAARHGLTALEIRWADVRHVYLTDDGLKLSPLRAKNARFEALRGVYLRFDDTNREAVIAAVRRLRLEERAGG